MSSVLSSGRASDFTLPPDKKAMAMSTEKTASFILRMLFVLVVVVLLLSVDSPTNCSGYDSFLESLYISASATLSQDEVIHPLPFVVFKDNEQNLFRES